MLTPERHQIILETVKKYHTAKIKDLVQSTGASESTIRRDLDQLEHEGLLRRVHGGASLRASASDEPSMGEKITKYHKEKNAIASYAASLVRDGDCIFLDAGSTTYEMISYLYGKDITVVTNGLDQLDKLTEYQIKTYVVGGYVKHRTRAVIGTVAMQNLQQYRFDQCFMGTNGISLRGGFSTPDPEEAAIKSTALSLSQERYILADHSKFEEISFGKFANLDEAYILTNYEGLYLNDYKEKTNIKVVTT
ncbi:DeoR/GlpR family DNA-binding transcription regulator [Halobacillus halophilus]|uniref:DeoR/GlpR family DNA-binding transcription regulator n=1 Tax=Halobacillus halophilus TaxID=1570 RepID=UPI001CD5E789|nr:DeoR/GlpR family DNA-binding transcription regulator [Halobacillus halophilus]MCA1011165.1 DeoR/GlpR family DNA-binding transcription regulator [Halobacillus halophilus]